jgi:hypothetical protein
MLSQVLTKNLNPVWNQTFEFVVEDAIHDMLIAEVWDHDTFGKVMLPHQVHYIAHCHIIVLLSFCLCRYLGIVLCAGTHFFFQSSARNLHYSCKIVNSLSISF